jgi:hypothetical protein
VVLRRGGASAHIAALLLRRLLLLLRLRPAQAALLCRSRCPSLLQRRLPVYVLHALAPRVGLRRGRAGDDIAAAAPLLLLLLLWWLRRAWVALLCRSCCPLLL